MDLSYKYCSHRLSEAGQEASLSPRDSLVEAVKAGNLSLVQTLCGRYRLPIETCDDEGNTLLSIACKHGVYLVAENLLDSGALVDCANNVGNTPLIWASSNGHERIVKLLLDRGATINVRNHKGKNALMVAETAGYQNIRNLIIGDCVNHKSKPLKTLDPQHRGGVLCFSDQNIKIQNTNNAVQLPPIVRL